MTNEKHFPKIISHWEFDFGLLTSLPRIIVARDFFRSSVKLKKLSFLSWQNTYPNLKTTYHIKLKLFLWTKLLELTYLSFFHMKFPARVKKSWCQVFSLCFLHFFICKISPSLDLSSIWGCLELLMSNQSHTSYSLHFSLCSNSLQVPTKYDRFDKYVQY